MSVEIIKTERSMNFNSSFNWRDLKLLGVGFYGIKKQTSSGD